MIYEGVNIKYCDWVIKEINIKKKFMFCFEMGEEYFYMYFKNECLVL